MNVVFLTPTNQSEIIAEAVEILEKGGSVVYPTDTVYGLGVNIFDDFAVRRLFRIKKRPLDRPIPIIVKSIAMAKKLAYIDPWKEKVLRAVWPGPVSIVLYKRNIISNLISANTQTVALRIPANSFCVGLIRKFNSPITSTSANISDKKHTNDPAMIIQHFEKELYKPDLIIDSGVLKETKPSTILDLTKQKPRITRIGPVGPKELASILKI